MEKVHLFLKHSLFVSNWFLYPVVILNHNVHFFSHCLWQLQESKAKKWKKMFSTSPTSGMLAVSYVTDCKVRASIPFKLFEFIFPECYYSSCLSTAFKKKFSFINTNFHMNLFYTTAVCLAFSVINKVLGHILYIPRMGGKMGVPHCFYEMWGVFLKKNPCPLLSQLVSKRCFLKRIFVIQNCLLGCDLTHNSLHSYCNQSPLRNCLNFCFICLQYTNITLPQELH